MMIFNLKLTVVNIIQLIYIMSVELIINDPQPIFPTPNY